MNIEESNELIAVFMGNEVTGPGIPMGIWFEDIKDFIQFQDLKYHSSWNWIMPVVKKCLNLTMEDLENYEKQYENIDDSFYQVNIDQTYKAVVEFIKWYNKNKKE